MDFQVWRVSQDIFLSLMAFMRHANPAYYADMVAKESDLDAGRFPRMTRYKITLIMLWLGRYWFPVENTLTDTVDGLEALRASFLCPACQRFVL